MVERYTRISDLDGYTRSCNINDLTEVSSLLWYPGMKPEADGMWCLYESCYREVHRLHELVKEAYLEGAGEMSGLADHLLTYKWEDSDAKKRLEE